MMTYLPTWHPCTELVQIDTLLMASAISRGLAWLETMNLLMVGLRIAAVPRTKWTVAAAANSLQLVGNFLPRRFQSPARVEHTHMTNLKKGVESGSISMVVQTLGAADRPVSAAIR